MQFDKLREKVDRITRAGAVSDASLALIYLFLRTKFGIDEHSFVDCITDGGNDLGVDAIYINKSGGSIEIHAIQSKFYTSERKASNAFKTTDLKKFRDFLLAVKNREADLSKLSNPALRAKIDEIRELLRKEFLVFKLWCLSNGTKCQTTAVELFQQEIEKLDAEIEEFHLSEFYSFCLANASKRSDHAFNARGEEIVEFGSETTQGIMGLISGEQLFNLIDDITEPGVIDFGIFDRNIRGFLGSNNQINKQIYKSAVSENNDKFWCLNNGITMTCSKFQVSRMSDSPKVKAKNLRIVNGAQTCGAIFKAINDYNADFSKFKNLAVGFRLYQTEDPTFVDRIAITSNSQNRVNSRDLKANHEYQLLIEKELEVRGIRYLRKRGITEEYENFDEIEDDLELRAIDALKVGQIILAYFLKQPDRSKRDSDHIFEGLYEPVFSSIDFDELHFAIQLYREIIRFKEYVEEEKRIRISSGTQRDFISYGVFHVLYACKLLGDRDEIKKRDIRILVDEAVSLVDKVVQEAGNPAHYVFFRNPDTVKKIQYHGLQPTLFDFAQLEKRNKINRLF